MNESTSPDFELLPCGCRMGSVGETFVMEPCRPDCQYWLYAISRVKEQCMPVQAIVDPDVEPEAAVQALRLIEGEIAR